MATDPIKELQDKISDLSAKSADLLHRRRISTDAQADKILTDQIADVDKERRTLQQQLTRLMLGKNESPVDTNTNDVDLIKALEPDKNKKLSAPKQPSSIDDKLRRKLLLTQQQIADRTLANIKPLKSSTPIKASTFKGFSIPRFTTDNSTGIVIACIFIIFGLEIGAGTKFVSLWNYAFSPSTPTVTTTGSGPIDEPSFSEIKAKWGIPDYYRYLQEVM